MQLPLECQICNAAVPLIIRVSEHTLFIIHYLPFEVLECVMFPGTPAVACTSHLHNEASLEP